ncbi:hypothetical protein NQ317_010473 [Molorchus minor]|uniref:Uncharacterized protein n=1 Tax=Molorchus minor TaxID=1323400 RepID=A0ABQ9JYE5_9CUCU|nr:hypothetical protein NQ317_010473 [Molorchus minor]
MLRYDSSLDQYTDVLFDDLSDSSDEDANSKLGNSMLIFRKRNKSSKSRSNIIKHFNLARIIRKSGRLNIFLTKLPNKNISYIRDLGNTLLTIRWRWILMTLVLVNFICFLVFGVLWYMLALHSGDFDRNHTNPLHASQCRNDHNHWIWLSLSNGKLSRGRMVSLDASGFTWSRHSRCFDKYKTAVICLRDGKLCFMFRINDFSSKIWCGTNLSLYFMDKEQNRLEMVQMEIEPHGLLIFPLEIEHIIDEASPLWTFRPFDVLQARFEIIAVAEGSSNITGQVSQNRTSYSNADIHWGHQFQPCVEYDQEKQAYIVDYKKFKETVPFDTPLCSAKMFYEIQRRIKETRRRNKIGKYGMKKENKLKKKI